MSKLKFTLVTLGLLIAVGICLGIIRENSPKKETLYLNGVLVGNDFSDEESKFINKIEMEDGSVYIYKSFNKLIDTEDSQNISLGDYNGVGTVTILRICNK